MRIAVVGGGINGVCAAWQLALAGHIVQLFERDVLFGATSSSSSKLLHGGLRYLENFEFRLVREALNERNWWLAHVPQHTKLLQLCLPIYASSQRSSFMLRLGLNIYDCLAGFNNIGRHGVLSKEEISLFCPQLKTDGLHRIFTFYDGQMDELGLGSWVAEQARSAGAILLENQLVQSMKQDGSIVIAGKKISGFDFIVNITGPWAEQLNTENNIASRYSLDLVRGSHIILNRCNGEKGYFLEIPGERRIFFVLPYQGKTLVGTTEKRQQLNEEISCDPHEVEYLLSAYNHYFIRQADESAVIDTFAGIRPLIKSASDPRKATRDYAIERVNRVITVFGGKWTTARALGLSVVKEVQEAYGIH